VLNVLVFAWMSPEGSGASACGSRCDYLSASRIRSQQAPAVYSDAVQSDPQEPLRGWDPLADALVAKLAGQHREIVRSGLLRERKPRIRLAFLRTRIAIDVI